MATPASLNVTQEYLDEYNGVPINITAIVFIILDTIVVLLRYWSRRLQSASYGWDDWLIIPAWIFCIVNCILALINIDYFGGARHIEYLELNPELIPKRGALDLYVESSIYCIAVTWPKLSILVLYLRVFTDRFSRVICWILFAIISLAAPINVLVIIFQCSPRSKAWNPSEPGWCSDIEAHFIWGSFPNIFTDFIMLLLPLPVIWRLHASWRVKAGIMATFFIGSIGMIASIIRFSEFFDNRFVNGDQSWDDNPLAIWVVVEPSMYLISACLLSFRVLFRTLGQSRLVSTFYTWLHRNSHYSSFDAPRPEHADDRAFPLKDKKPSGLDSVSGLVAPFAGRSGSSWGAVADRGDNIELGEPEAGAIHVQRDLEIRSTKA